MVDERELGSYPKDGWQFVSVLPSRKILYQEIVGLDDASDFLPLSMFLRSFDLVRTVDAPRCVGLSVNTTRWW